MAKPKYIYQNGGVTTDRIFLNKELGPFDACVELATRSATGSKEEFEALVTAANSAGALRLALGRAIALLKDEYPETEWAERGITKMDDVLAKGGA